MIGGVCRGVSPQDFKDLEGNRDLCNELHNFAVRFREEYRRELGALPVPARTDVLWRADVMIFRALVKKELTQPHPTSKSVILKLLSADAVESFVVHHLFSKMPACKKSSFRSVADCNICSLDRYREQLPSQGAPSDEVAGQTPNFKLTHTYTSAGEFTDHARLLEEQGVWTGSTVQASEEIRGPPFIGRLDKGKVLSVDEGSVCVKFETAWLVQWRLPTYPRASLVLTALLDAMAAVPTVPTVPTAACCCSRVRGRRAVSTGLA